MAQMPRGEPRSVPDPDGELYDEMIRQERLKKQRTETGTGRRRPFLEGAEASSPFETRLEFLRQPARRNSIVTVGGREIDSRCAVFPKDPQISPAELAEQRRAIERAFFIAQNPVAGVAYGVATMAGASPGARDGALAAGGLIDAALVGAAPRGAPIQARAEAPRAQPPAPIVTRPRIRFGELNSQGQATAAEATLTEPMLGGGSRIRWNPPGWQGNGNTYNEARAHLLARQLGGTGRDRRNGVTMTQRGANSPQMSGFENAVARRVKSGEVVEYRSMPLYGSTALPPEAVLLTAHGTRSAPAAKLVLNPAGRPQ